MANTEIPKDACVLLSKRIRQEGPQTSKAEVCATFALARLYFPTSCGVSSSSSIAAAFSLESQPMMTRSDQILEVQER
jgi:hypothetical protein